MTNAEMLAKLKETVEKLNFYLSSKEYIVFVFDFKKRIMIEFEGSFSWNGTLLLQEKDGGRHIWLLGFNPLKNVYPNKELKECLDDLKQFKVVPKEALKPIL